MKMNIKHTILLCLIPYIANAKEIENDYRGTIKTTTTSTYQQNAIAIEKVNSDANSIAWRFVVSPKDPTKMASFISFFVKKNSEKSYAINFIAAIIGSDNKRNRLTDRLS
jgi:hypothetical protein